MKNRLSPYFHTLASVCLVVVFTACVYAQGSITDRETDTEIFVKVLGWIMLSGAAITHIATNIYTVVKGKNYEQLKEAAANYKELAESRRAQLAEVRAEKAALEIECENLKERILRL